jgi:hypothetical protein
LSPAKPAILRYRVSSTKQLPKSYCNMTMSVADAPPPKYGTQPEGEILL